MTDQLRPEPRAMTLLDWLLGFAGFAIASALPSPFSFHPYAVMSPVFVVGILALMGLLFLAMMITLIVVGRQVVHHRAPRSAEWLVIIVVALVLSAVVPNLDTTIDGVQGWLAPDAEIDWSLSRWSVAAGTVLFAVALAAVYVRWRRVIPGWLLTVGAVLAIAVLWWAANDVFVRDTPWPEADIMAWSSVFLRELYLSGRTAFATLPTGVLLAIPCLAAIRSLRQGRSRWLWTEGASAVTAGLLCGLSLAALVMPLVEASLAERFAGVLAGLMWLIAAVGIAVVARRLVTSASAHR